MRIAVIGGGLQGVEAAYLAKKAGWEVWLFDRKPAPTAKGLADHFVRYEFAGAAGLETVLSGVDLVLPALENGTALECLTIWAQTSDTPFVFDGDAYALSSSKTASNQLFEHLKLPIPLTWPQCDPPLLAKPAYGSGSHGVRVLADRESLQACFPGPEQPEGWVLQEFLSGPVYSLEVIGYHDQYQVLQVTDLSMDAGYDCKRVLAPSQLSPDMISKLEEMALTIARAIHLSGIMDIEAVCCRNALRILEIDARLPSQTPITVFKSSGLNMVEMLGELFCGRRKAATASTPPLQGAILEHVRLRDGVLEIGGEHLMTTGGPLHLEPNFFGTDEAITNYEPGKAEWVAALIISGLDRGAAWRKRNQTIEHIMTEYCVKQYADFEPTEPHQVYL